MYSIRYIPVVWSNGILAATRATFPKMKKQAVVWLPVKNFLLAIYVSDVSEAEFITRHEVTS